MTRRTIAALILTAALLPLTVVAGPPEWAPAHGYRMQQHRYVYYPRQQVYYAPETHAWFWLDGGRWRVGASLPAGVVVAGAPGVSIMLGTPLPYERHVEVVETYSVRPYRVRWDDDHRRPRHRRHHHHHHRDHD